jgi:hypothetical protein
VRATVAACPDTAMEVTACQGSSSLSFRSSTMPSVAASRRKAPGGGEGVEALSSPRAPTFDASHRIRRTFSSITDSGTRPARTA